MIFWMCEAAHNRCPHGAMTLTSTASRHATPSPSFLQAPNPYRCRPAYTDEHGWLLDRKGLAPDEDPLPVSLGFYRPHEWGTAPYTPVSACGEFHHTPPAAPSIPPSPCGVLQTRCPPEEGWLPTLRRVEEEEQEEGEEEEGEGEARAALRKVSPSAQHCGGLLTRHHVGRVTSRQAPTPCSAHHPT
jgi:hypothetical protein